MYCDIKDGKLMENGVDPFYVAKELQHGSVQCNLDERSEQQKLLQGVQSFLGASAGIGRDPASDMKLANFALTSSPSAQVLRLVVGLLGLEVHAAPRTSAESWLTYQDDVDSKLGLAGPVTKALEGQGEEGNAQDVATAGGRAVERDAVRRKGKQEQDGWQFKVLSHLRRHIEAAISNATASPKADHKAVKEHNWGPEFPEHLETAEYILRRVTSAVNVLQDPEKSDRPLVLREYTEKMVVDVCKDLRQWLEQMATLFSLYHVHLMDLEQERRGLAHKLSVKQAQFDKGEQDRKEALSRAHVIEENAKAERMKKRAEEMLGMSLGGADDKIYTEQDKQEFYQTWRHDELEPVLAELRELRASMKEKPDKSFMKRKASIGAAGGRTIGEETMGLLIGITNAIANKTEEDGTRGWLLRLAEGAGNNGAGLEELLAEINSAPSAPSSPAGGKKGAAKKHLGSGEADKNSPVGCLEAVSKELARIENELQACSGSGLEPLATVSGWARGTVDAAIQGLRKSGNDAFIEWNEAPKWDLKKFKSRSSSKTAGVNMTAGTTSPSSRDRPPPAAVGGGVADHSECEARLDALRKELEAKLAAALALAERERQRAEEAIRRLAEEMEKFEKAMAELRAKLAAMEKMLNDDGFGRIGRDAILKSGLSDFMAGRDVFERLYRDALNRMRRLAEAQAKSFVETSHEFLNIMSSAANSPLLRMDIPLDQCKSPSPRSQRLTVDELLAQARQPSPGPEYAPGDAADPSLMQRRGSGSPTPVPSRRTAAPSAPHISASASVPPDRGSPRPHTVQVPGMRSKGTPLRSSKPPWEGGELDLMIGGAGRMTGMGGPSAALRQSTCASPTKDLLLMQRRSSRPVDGAVLPPLECQGRRAGSPDAIASRADLVTPSKHRSPSPPLGKLGDASRWPPGARPGVLQFDGVGMDIPPMAIAGVGPRPTTVGGSLLLPPGMRAGASPQPKAHGSSASQRSDGKLQGGGKGGASKSTPTLPTSGGPPRLLVQSVSAAH